MNGIKVLPLAKKGGTATAITSLTVIGAVVSANITALSDELRETLGLNKNLLRFNSASEALEAFKDVSGTAREVLYDINMQNVNSPIILSLVAVTATHLEKEAELFYADTKVKTAVVTAVSNLKYARTIYSSKVRLAIAPYFSHDITVRNALDTFAKSTNIIAIADLNTDSVTKALPLLKASGSSRLAIAPFYRRTYSIFLEKSVTKPVSAVIAGHIAYWDANLGEFGFAFDHANRAINDVEATAVHLDYQEGSEECEVNVIANAGGIVLLNDDGWKLYNFKTTIDDEVLNKLERVRYFDTMTEAMQKTLKKHKHRPMSDVLNLAKADAEALAGKAVLAGASVGNLITWSAQNTTTELEAGNIYMDYADSTNVGMRSLTIQPYATDEFYTLSNLITGDE